MPKVTFRVQDSATWTAIAGATCTVRAPSLTRSGTTNAQGIAEVSFSSQEWGTMLSQNIVLEVSHPNYRSAQATFRLDPFYKDKDWGPHLFGLARLPGYVPPGVSKVLIEVRDARTKELVRDAKVIVSWDYGGGRVSQTMAARNGTVEFEMASGVRYTVKAEAPGYKPAQTTAGG